MHDFIIMITGPRYKIGLIKMVRFITGGGGLKYCKDIVESCIDFETWMDSEVTFELRVDASMLANLTHYILDDHDEFKIVSSQRVDMLRVDMDLTAGYTQQ